jgi:hypothetical protein
MIDWSVLIAVLTPVGGAAAFVWNKVEKRFRELDRKLEKCEQRDRNSQSRREKHVAIIELLWREVDRLDPSSRALRRARHLIDDLKKEAKTAGENTP